MCHVRSAAGLGTGVCAYVSTNQPGSQRADDEIVILPGLGHRLMGARYETHASRSPGWVVGTPFAKLDDVVKLSLAADRGLHLALCTLGGMRDLH